MDTAKDPWLGRIFLNRTIRRYPAFSEFYGMEETIERIVGFFRHAAQGLEECKQILYLLGPIGGGKSSLAERLKVLMNPSRLRQIAAAKTEPGDENNQDISSLVGKVDIRKLEMHAQNAPDAYSFSGGLNCANQGMLEFVEMFKAPIKMLHPLRDAAETRQRLAVERAARSRACPFDLHRVLPVPERLLRRGPDHPETRTWLWAAWGTTQALRHVTELPVAGRGQPRRQDPGLFWVGFWSADWTPWRAVLQLRTRWPGLRLEVRPIYDPG